MAACEEKKVTTGKNSKKTTKVQIGDLLSTANVVYDARTGLSGRLFTNFLAGIKTPKTLFDYK